MIDERDISKTIATIGHGYSLNGVPSTHSLESLSSRGTQSNPERHFVKSSVREGVGEEEKVREFSYIV